MSKKNKNVIQNSVNSFEEYKELLRKRRVRETKINLKKAYNDKYLKSKSKLSIKPKDYPSSRQFIKNLDTARRKDVILCMIESKTSEYDDFLYKKYEEYCEYIKDNLDAVDGFAGTTIENIEKYSSLFYSKFNKVAKEIYETLHNSVREYVDELSLQDVDFIQMETISQRIGKEELGSIIASELKNECIQKNDKTIIEFIYFNKLGIEEFEEYVLDYIYKKANAQSLIDFNIAAEERELVHSIILGKVKRKSFMVDENIFVQSIAGSKMLKTINKQLQEYEIKSMMLLKDSIPKRMADMYPLARNMKRHFVLHVGPTNSGKTYDSIEKLKKVNRGIYLAPLRLLAYEIYDKINDAGIPCNMLTGEEAIEIPGAKHISCTVEMLDELEEFDLAVIDEGQNIADESRGGAWTKAILGVRAKEVHICSDSSCVDIVKKLIEQCDDTYEIVNHERMTRLILDRIFNVFPQDVRDRDAIIVFSKKAVMAVASDLQKKGIPASILYGNLPYDVRLNEVRRFVSGETKVVVATDAIGMGVNLPIKRVILLETKKFDGKSLRHLYPTEIKQIVGRAGRRGMFDIGYFTSEFDKGFIKKAAFDDLEPIDRARVNFPEAVVNIDMPLSELLRKWYDIPDEGIYVKSIIENDLLLCQELEKIIKDKQLIYKCITIAFDERNKKLHGLLIELANAQNKDYDQCKEEIRNIVEKWSIVFDEDMNQMTLDELGEQYSVYDLLYAFLRKFDHKEYLNVIMDLKKDCSKKMMYILQTQELEGRTCATCGAPLKWNYPYRTCKDCYIKNGE